MVGPWVLTSPPRPLRAHPLPRAPLAALEDEEEKIGEYRRLLDTLPTVNRATLKALINHLFRYDVDGQSHGMAEPGVLKPPWGISPTAVGSWDGGEPSSLGTHPKQGAGFGVKLCPKPSITSQCGAHSPWQG